MKFLATGNIRDPRGPKKIILFTYIFFIFFICINWILEILNTPFTKDEFFSSIETSFTIRLEKLHIQIFLFGFILIFDFSTLFSSKLKKEQKNTLFILVVMFYLLYLFSLLIYGITDWYYYFYWFNVLGFHFVLLVLQLLLIKDLG